MVQLLQQHLNHVRQQQKVQADAKCTKRSFQVGEWVFLKLQPYVQTSIAHRPYPKLAFKYYGPYTVLQRIGHPESSVRPKSVNGTKRRAKLQLLHVMLVAKVQALVQSPEVMRWDEGRVVPVRRIR